MLKRQIKMVWILYIYIYITFIFIFLYIYIYLYIYYIYMVFTTEAFLEEATESWPEWDLNP